MDIASAITIGVIMLGLAVLFCDVEPCEIRH